jgi:hypothetical protein
MISLDFIFNNLIVFRASHGFTSNMKSKIKNCWSIIFFYFGYPYFQIENQTESCWNCFKTHQTQDNWRKKKKKKKQNKKG